MLGTSWGLVFVAIKVPTKNHSVPPLSFPLPGEAQTTCSQRGFLHSSEKAYSSAARWRCMLPSSTSGLELYSFLVDRFTRQFNSRGGTEQIQNRMSLALERWRCWLPAGTLDISAFKSLRSPSFHRTGVALSFSFTPALQLHQCSHALLVSLPPSSLARFGNGTFVSTRESRFKQTCCTFYNSQKASD